MPGADPAAPVEPDQAAALIRRYLDGTTEERLVLRDVRLTGPQRGFAELTRRFRPSDGSASRSETVLLGFRRENLDWVLVELRVIR